MSGRASSSPTPPIHRSWRGPQRGATSPGVRRFYRWLFTLLAAALVTTLIYLLLPARQSVTYLVAVTNANYVEHAVPPIPFAVDDARVLQHLADLRPTLVMAEQMQDPSAAQLSALAVGPIAQHLADSDVLVVYISGHGVAINGTAYLLCSGEFRWNRTATDGVSEGMLPVSKLFEPLLDLPAKLKLLVLDTQWLTADPRLGVLVNEFPYRTEQEVRQVKDSSLWVLLSGSTFERCETATPQRQSLFGLSFAQALVGSADQNDDQRLSLAELYGHLLSGCMASLPMDGRRGQTPLLMHAGDGLVQLRDIASSELFVAATPPLPPPEAASAAGGPAGEDATGNQASSTTRDPLHARRAAATAANRLRGRAVQPVPPAVRRAATTAREAGQPAQSIGGGPVEADAPAAANSGTATPGPVRPATSPGDQKPLAPQSPTGNDARPADTAAKSTSAVQPPQTGQTTPAPTEPAPATPARPAPQPAASLAAGAPSGDPALPRLRRSLHAAWLLRDRLAHLDLGEPQQATMPRRKWSPVDFAPDLWRSLNSRLLAYEQRCRAGMMGDVERAGPDAEELTAELDRIVRGLTNLATEMEHPGSTATPRNHWVTDGLWAAWRHAGGGRAPPQSVAAQGPPNGLAENVRLLNDMLFLAPYYVCWHGRASLASDTPLPQTGPLVAWLRRLEQLADGTTRIDHLPLSATTQKELTSRRIAVIAAWRTLEVSLQQARARALEQLRQGIERPVVDQLDTLYLAAGDRQRLLTQLLDLNRPQPAALDAAPTARQSDSEINLAVTAAQGQRLARQLGMHSSLIRLAYGADSDTAAALNTAQERLDRWGRTRGDGDSRQLAFWEACGQASQTLEQAYATPLHKADDLLAHPLSVAGVAAASQHLERVWRLLCMADPRDVTSLRPQCPIDVYASMGILPQIALTLRPPQRVTVDLTDWQRVTATVTARLLTATNAVGAVQLRVDFDTNLLEVRPATSSDRLSSGQTERVALGPDGTVSRGYLVRRRSSLAWHRQSAAELKVSVHGSAAQSDRATVSCFPNEVTVHVVRVGSGGVVKDQAVGPRIELRPFPNRPNPFLVRLQNRTGVARSVDLQLLALPRPAEPTGPPGRLVDESGTPLPWVHQAVFDVAGQVKAGIVTVAQTANPVTLPADAAQQVTVEFAPEAAKPADEQPPGKPRARPLVAAKADRQAAADPAAAAATDKGPIITHGLIALVRDHAQEGQPVSPWEWQQWLEITTLTPRSYIDATCQCDGHGKITVRAKLRAGPADRPADWETAPIPIECRLDDQSGGSPTGLPEASIAAPREVASTWLVVATSQADRRPMQVHLNVDHYPRAFTFEVRPWQQLRPRDILDTRPQQSRIQISRLGRRGADHVFRPPQLAAFRPAGDPIHVWMQVDAPLNAFQQLGVSPPPDSIELAVQYVDRTRQTVATLYADRAIETRLEKIDSSGRLILRTTVTDFQLPIGTRGPRNERFTIRADLRLQTRIVRSSSIEAIVDDQPPQLRILNANRIAPTSGGDASANRLRVELDAQDQSGIEDDQITFDLKRNGLPDKPTPLVPLQISRLADDETRLVDLDIRQFDPGQYLLTAHATDRASNQAVSPSYPIVLRQRPAAAKPQTKNGVIRGRVRKGTFYADGVTVRLQGAGLPDQPTENGGQFLFRDVPPGKYTIVAQGPVLGITHSGQLDNVQPTPAGQPPKIWVVELGRVKQ